MSTKLFVGSLSWDTKDDGLKQFFSQFGNVVSASVITYRDTGRSKGFGFVEMASDEDAKKAVDMWNGKELDERTLRVNVAQPRASRM